MKKIFSILMVCAVAVSATAVPARRDGVVRTLEDGTEVTVYQNGDENFHYLTNEAGEWYEQNTEGQLKPIPALSEEQVIARRESGKYAQAQARRIRKAQQETGVSRLLAPKGAVLLVQFSDTKFTYSKESMIEWATGENYTVGGATGSIREYFYDQSFGQYNLQLDVYGPYTISKAASYYGGNDSGGSDQHPDEMVQEACKLAIADGVDFTQYDYDNDGYVDWVVTVYAGKGEADSDDESAIWPHQYELSYTGKTVKQGNKTIDHYCCVNEINGQGGGRAGIGVFVHEFSHILGLPDLYTTNYATQKTLGEWDIMDYGPYNNDLKTPPAYSAYERWWMGWLEPILLNSAASVTMPYLSTSKAAAYITTNGEAISNILSPGGNDFYILENRQKIKWDAHIPGHGLLITKIHYKYNWWKYNQVNNTASTMGVDLLEADGKAPSQSSANPNNGYYGKAGDAFPQGATSYSGITGYPITGITENNQTITFDVAGGGAPITLGMESIFPEDGKPVKFMQNGLFYFFRNGKIYDMNGRLIY